MDTQEMYDKVVNHLRAQGPRAMPARGWSYGNPGNPCERCAKGILMSYEDSLSNIAGSPDDRIEKYLERKLTFTEMELLNSLEFIFEVNKFEEWEEKFETVAHVYDLIYSPVNVPSPVNEEVNNVIIA